VLATVAVAAATLLAVSPGAAFARPSIALVPIDCPDFVGSDPGMYYQPLHVISSWNGFQASETRVVVNNTDLPSSATFTSSVSRTFGTSTSVGFAVNIVRWLIANVSESIMSSTTTNIGVSATGTVPPHKRLFGDYGVTTYEVDVEAYAVLVQDGGGCAVQRDTMGYEQHHATAPTNDQGWNLRIG